MKRIKVKPPYISLTQQKLCCVPCAIQWILLRRGLKLVEQEAMGKALDLVIPKKHQHLFLTKIKTSKKESRYGVNNSEEKQLNRFFVNNKINLKVRKIYYSEIGDIQNVTKIISENIKRGNDIMVTSYMSPVKRTEKYGHALLVSEIILNSKPKIIVGDPSYLKKKFYEVDLGKIVKGMSGEFDGDERAIYIFSKQ